MSAQFKKGESVTQVIPKPITGTVEGFHMNEETGETQYLVQWDEDGDKKSRYFSAEQLVSTAKPDEESTKE